MASSTDTCSTMEELFERERRKPGASGIPVTLSNGEDWLLAVPVYRPGPSTLTEPCVDCWLDSFFDLILAGENPTIEQIWEVAWVLLLANYQLTDDEVAELLIVSSAAVCETLARAVLEAIVGPTLQPQSYSDWIRASLLCNGVSGPLNPRHLSHVLAVLAATNRTVPMAEFVSSCRAFQEHEILESLV